MKQLNELDLMWGDLVEVYGSEKPYIYILSDDKRLDKLLGIVWYRMFFINDFEVKVLRSNCDGRVLARFSESYEV